MTKKTLEENEKKQKKVSKKDLKKAHEIEKQAMNNERFKIEEKIDALIQEKKGLKNKAKKKELNKEIKELKYQRSRIGAKDTYLSNVMAEMRLVRWPSRSEVVKYSLATLVFVVLFALFFFGIDALFALVKDLIN